MNKQKIVKLIMKDLTEKYETLCQVARNTYEGATHDESRAEDKYDTRGLEASYLAGAQAKRTIEIEQALSKYRTLPVIDFGADDPIGLTALVEVESDGANSFYFIGPEGGGMKIDLDGKTIMVITPESPLGKSLIDKELDDEFDVKMGNSVRNYSIVDIC